jgi:signal transduction histidine kinase
LPCGGAPNGPDTGAATHLIKAQLLVLPGNAFAQAPQHMQLADLPAAGWQDVDLPHVTAGDKQAHSAGAPSTLVHWYRFDDLFSTPSSEPGYLYIPRWKNGGQIAVYADGQLLYQTEGSLAYNGFNRPLLLRLPSRTSTEPGKVLLRLERLAGSRSALSTVWVGSSQALAWRYQWRHFLQTQLPFMGAAAFLVVGFFSLAIWFSRRHEWLYFLFFAASTLAFLRMLHYFVGGSYLPLSDDWFTWLTVASLLWLIVLVNNFLERLHKRPLRWLNPVLIVVTTFCSVLTMPGATSLVPNLESITPALYLALLPLTLLIFAVALRNALQSGEWEVKLMAAWVLLAVTSSAYDLMLQNNHVSPEGLYTNPYAIVGLFVMFTYIMYQRYVAAMGEVEQVNASLAKRLQTREAELAISYERLRDVEHRQTISNERQRLMQDMHDGLGSSLTSALRVVEGGRLGEADVAEVLKSCIDDLKLAIDSMEPVDADLLLLLATLRFRLGPRLTAAGIALKWEVVDLPKLDWLDPRNALHILRMLQEAFANILKHTQATDIRVMTVATADGIEVSITDNGQGFDVAKTLSQGGGRGLHNQQRRAEAIEGVVSWSSGSGGTTFTLWLPLKRRFASI